MRIGALRQRLTLQSLVETKDAYGQMVKSWATVATVYGEVRPLQGRELVNAAQIKADLTHLVTMRYIDSLEPGKRTVPSERILFKGRTLNIIDVANVDERDRTLVLHCQELVNS